jgi:hypothetical protein
MSKDIRRRMSDAHEEHLAARFGGKQHAGSGNQWNRPMDGSHNRHERKWAFAWDGKATLAKSVGVTLAMWQKAKEQAGFRIPMLALRYYGDDRLSTVTADLVVLDADDFANIIDRLEELEQQCSD